MALCRPALPNEVATLAKLYESRHAHYVAHPEDALKFATDPLGPLSPGQTAVELAALTAVANVILNLDEFVTKN